MSKKDIIENYFTKTLLEATEKAYTLGREDFAEDLKAAIKALEPTGIKAFTPKEINEIIDIGLETYREAIKNRDGADPAPADKTQNQGEEE